MRTAIASKIPTTAAQSGVIDFPSFARSQQSKTNDSFSNEIVNSIIGNSQFEEYLRDKIEGIVFSQWTKNITLMKTTEDPFDAIYIADLKPDFIQKKYIENLKLFASNITDKSNEIQFDDGWDD